MAKFFAIVAAAAALIAGVQAENCPRSAPGLCGSDLIDNFKCSTELSLTFITPAGNNPRDCVFPVSSGGDPQGAGVFCCAQGQCKPNGLGQAHC
ncbi:hypothetical protein B0H66DRAFT_570828 [Apodospora peruviana]|uniref:Uncharacterized protein n=1 Tax=Apodospora peruviana TaxID=516989 RepID=A0AAE0HTC2_9PEZI|nr:hypothetical protein B0H66DRAFT_570828 [Apodospora peruviana]